ncbi:hypothetical protein BCR44DRAFT_1198443 [Catenaria anguillulae PL171]|uniref:Uncharacterized protein n=1 Tax=Catenaria anguillulae PL171 TaxID=765915 RepID=A0A1Y2HFY4_9FUNG|nr:hypothetical protein BCR44DRAFT_1198443 [Catenaria anguillulae PL171]
MNIIHHASALADPTIVVAFLCCATRHDWCRRAKPRNRRWCRARRNGRQSGNWCRRLGRRCGRRGSRRRRKPRNRSRRRRRRRHDRTRCKPRNRHRCRSRRRQCGSTWRKPGNRDRPRCGSLWHGRANFRVDLPGRPDNGLLKECDELRINGLCQRVRVGLVNGVQNGTCQHGFVARKLGLCHALLECLRGGKRVAEREQVQDERQG